MSNIDKQKLREAAQKATKGQWAVEFDDEIYSTDGVNHEQIAMIFSENEVLDAAFIEAANPATVLALLDELEASQSENERLAKTLIERNGEPVEGLVKRVAELEEIATDYGMKFQRAQDALKHQSLLHKTQIEAAEKRIAELTDSLKQTVSGYKSCLRTGHDRILDLGGGCDSPEVMIAGNPDIQQAEKLLATAAGKGE